MKALLVIVFFIPGILCIARPLPASQISSDSITKIKIKKNGEVKTNDWDYRFILIGVDNNDNRRRIKIGGSLYKESDFGAKPILCHWLVSWGKNKDNGKILGAELGFTYWAGYVVGFRASPLISYYVFDGSFKPAIRGDVVLGFGPFLPKGYAHLTYFSFGFETDLWKNNVHPLENIVISAFLPIWVPVKKTK